MSVFFVLRDDMVVEIRLKDLVKKGRFKMFEKWGLVKVNYWWSLSFLLENCVKMFFKGMMMFCGIFWFDFYYYVIFWYRGCIYWISNYWLMMKNLIFINYINLFKMLFIFLI